MSHWAKVGSDWLFLDSSVKIELLEKYPGFFTPIQNSSMSSVTYYADILTVSSLWHEEKYSEIKEFLSAASPELNKALKSLVTMVSDGDKAFADFPG